MSHFAVIAPALPSHYRALEALAGALIARGHQVTFIHQSDAAAMLQDRAVKFHAVGAQSHPPGALARSLKLAARPGGPMGLRRLIADLACTTDMLCRELPAVLTTLQADALVCDQMEAAGGLVAEALGLHYVSVACALPINREPGIPLPVMPMDFAHDDRAKAIYQGSERVYDWLMRPHRKTIAHHARTFGLSPREGLHECLSPYAQISQITPGFDLPRQHLPASFHAVGPLRPLAATTQQRLELAVDPARPFVFASLGTLLGQRYSLFRRIARAAKALDAQLLIAHCGGLAPPEAQALIKAGATWVTDFAPQQAVLERADAVVTHAGLNTVMDALSTRTPMLALPLAFDQPGVAARIVHAGVGLRAWPMVASGRDLQTKLKQLLTATSFRPPLERLSMEVNNAGGSRAAAEIVERATGCSR